MNASVLDALPALREQFLTTGRVVVEDLLPRGDSERIAKDLRALPFEPVSNVPFERRYNPRRQRLWHHFHIVEVAPFERTSPVQALVDSIARGPVRDLIAAIAARPALYNRVGRKHRPTLVAHAYPRGGYLEAHDDHQLDDGSVRSVGLVWHASARWEPAWGGALRFLSPEQHLAPQFGALHVFDVRRQNRHEVTMVRGPAIRYTLSGWLYEST